MPNFILPDPQFFPSTTKILKNKQKFKQQKMEKHDDEHNNVSRKLQIFTFLDPQSYPSTPIVFKNET